jgi:hypothetical protein
MRRYLTILGVVCILFACSTPVFAEEGMDEAMEEGADSGMGADDTPGMDVSADEGMDTTEQPRVEAAEEEVEDTSGPELEMDQPVAEQFDTGPSEGGGGAVETYLENSREWLRENKIFGKILIRPYVETNIVYDDNIYLNDKDEAGTEGRVWDLIWDSTIKIHFVLPTNENYTKLFKRKEMTLFGYDFNYQLYTQNHDTSSLNQYLWTDLFALFEDLLNSSADGNGFYGKLFVEWSDVSDPIDILIRDLQAPGFPIEAQEAKIQRQRVVGNAALGWTSNRFDAEIGYDLYWLKFKEDVFEQANQLQQNVYGEVGYRIPGTKDIRAFVHARYNTLRFDENYLNDADIQEYDIGAEGPLISNKLRFLAQVGWLIWDYDDTGLSGDDSDYDNATYLARIVYKPWERRALRFQLETSQQVNWSVISNYRLDRPTVFTVFDELIPKRLDGDVSVAYGYHRPSEGPIRYLWEVGAGLTYHPAPRVDVTLRYLYRNQKGSREETLITVDEGGNLQTLQTDNDFYQNVVQVGIAIWF